MQLMYRYRTERYLISTKIYRVDLLRLFVSRLLLYIFDSNISQEFVSQ